jgi:hypothetical protein
VDSRALREKGRKGEREELILGEKGDGRKGEGKIKEVKNLRLNRHSPFLPDSFSPNISSPFSPVLP